MILEHLPVLPVILPLIAACFIALLQHEGIARAISLSVAVIMPILSWVLLLRVVDGGVLSYSLGGWSPPIGIEYRIDMLNGFMLMLVSIVNLQVLSCARLSITLDVGLSERSWFYSTYLLCLSGCCGVLLTGDCFNAFVFLEIASLSSYAMISMGRDPRALVAAYQYLIVGTVGASFYVIAVGLLYIDTGTLNMLDMSARLSESGFGASSIAAFAFLTVGLGIKFALFPLHLWLPNAYAYAPCSATAFLSGTSTKVFVYLYLRFLFDVLGSGITLERQDIAWFLIMLGVLATIFASIAAFFQENVKRLLAYSSISQIGYIVVGIGLTSQTSLTGSVAHLFNHAVTKSSLFLALSAVTYRLYDTHRESFVGLGKRMPLTMGAFSIAAASLMGIPGTAGFVSKWYLAQAALEQGQWWLLVVLLLSSAAAVFYLGRILELSYFGEPSRHLAQAADPPLRMMIPLWVSVFSCIYFGFDTRFSIGIANKIAEMLLGGIG